MHNPAKTTYPIHELLKSRWSTRAYSSRPVEVEKLQSLLEAARWSPSASNTQPWYFVTVTQNEADLHARFVQTLMGKNQEWAKNAPVLVLAVAKMNPQRPALNQYAFYDLGQAVAHLSVQASELGLHVHQMGGFEADKTRQLFDIPEDYVPTTVIAIGYYGKADELPDDLREREQLPRTRKPLSEFVFGNTWGKPLEEIAEKQLVAEK